ncbi:hypothetical protein [Levilactobacillus brevis]|uniref:hypothetical protein n=1 Tax=Levilactobacillus brevis TaxID=1580 RepID=UPI000B3E729A|nr:hypothetical protein [Levilactobacillus brevis]ARW50306.1 hypothetical protein S101106_00798 [Levilactobacillus brevis]
MASNDEQRSATTILTTAAQSIAARLIANETTAKFTKAEISTTNLFNQSVTELQVLTSLDNVQQTADINTVTVINNNTVNVNVAIDQTKAPNNYQMNSVGLFAVDGDGKEVLYSVTVLKDPVYIHQDAMGSALGIDLETVVGQASNVEISVNPAGAVTNEILKATLADYVKTDDVKSLIPATVIDGSKPADFKESVTLEKGAVDGAGNAIATSKDVSDGDVETLTSAKDYADTQASDKVKTSDIDPSVMAKTTLTANDDVLALGPGTYYTWGVKPNNFPALAPWSTVVVKTVGNQPMDGKNVTITDTNAFQLVNTYSGNPPTGKWSGWRVPNSTAMASKTDVTTATANMVHRNPDTGSVSEPVDFTNLTVNGGKSVATSDDLKSVADKAWYQLDNKYITPASGYTLAPSTSILYKIDDSNHKLYLSGSIALTDSSAFKVPIIVQLGSIIKSIKTFDVPYFGYYDSNVAWNFVRASQSGTNLTFLPVLGLANITATTGTEGKLAYVTYDELI